MSTEYHPEYLIRPEDFFQYQKDVLTIIPEACVEVELCPLKEIKSRFQRICPLFNPTSCRPHGFSVQRDNPSIEPEGLFAGQYMSVSKMISPQTV